MLCVDNRALLKLMVQRDLTCRALGFASRVSTGTIAKLIREGGQCHIMTVAKIADSLGVDYKQLLKEEHHHA